MPTLDSILSVEELPKLEEPVVGEQAIIEENEDGWENESSPVAEAFSGGTSPLSEELPGPMQEQSFYRPPVRRAASHESLLSVSGMDIHTLKSRPSQLLAPYGGRGITSQAVISDTYAHAARPAAMSRPSDTGKSLLSGMAADQRQPATKSPAVGKKVGGWIFGRWGAAPATSTTEATTPTAKTISAKANKTGSISSASDKAPLDPQATPKKLKLRPAGINQGGPLLGFFPEVKAISQTPVIKNLDEEALKNLLNG